MGPAFPVGDLPGLADDGARSLDCLIPRLGIGGYFLCRVADHMAQEERHGAILANRAVRRPTGGKIFEPLGVLPFGRSVGI